MKKITKVRRDLFGPIDHEESARFIETELARKQTHDSERWGFDFSLGVPLDNNENFEWEPVYTFMPQYYSLQQQTRNRLVPEQTEQTLQYFQNPDDLSIMDIDTKLYEDLQPNSMSSGSSMESSERTPLQNHNTNQAPKKFRQLFITGLTLNFFSNIISDQNENIDQGYPFGYYSLHNLRVQLYNIFKTTFTVRSRLFFSNQNSK